MKILLRRRTLPLLTSGHNFKVCHCYENGNIADLNRLGNAAIEAQDMEEQDIEEQDIEEQDIEEQDIEEQDIEEQDTETQDMIGTESQRNTSHVRYCQDSNVQQYKAVERWLTQPFKKDMWSTFSPSNHDLVTVLSPNPLDRSWTTTPGADGTHRKDNLKTQEIKTQCRTSSVPAHQSPLGYRAPLRAGRSQI
jgi:hypothetical protein